MSSQQILRKIKDRFFIVFCLFRLRSINFTRSCPSILSKIKKYELIVRSEDNYIIILYWRYNKSTAPAQTIIKTFPHEMTDVVQCNIAHSPPAIRRLHSFCSVDKEALSKFYKVVQKTNLQNTNNQFRPLVFITISIPFHLLFTFLLESIVKVWRKFHWLAVSVLTWELFRNKLN